MRNRTWTILLCFHCLGLITFAQSSARRQLVLQVSNGGFVAFRSETSTSGSTKPNSDTSPLPAMLNSQVLADEGHIIHRILTDADGHVVFGYDLWVDANPLSRKFSLVVLPAEQAFRDKFLREGVKQHPAESFSTFAKATDAHTLDDGDAVSLELLVNEKSGVTIIDLVKVTFDRSSLRDNSLEAMPRDFTLDAVELTIKSYQLLIDGDLAGRGKSTRGCAGSLLWLYIPNQGRFIFSLVPREGYSFQKIGVLEENRIEFTANGNRYEWDSSSPILASGGAWNLWVLHDPQYTPLFGSDTPLSKNQSTLEKLARMVGGNGIDPVVTIHPQRSLAASDARADEGRVAVPKRVMIGAADRMENLLPKNP
jgi:hypothetical protein